MPVRKRREGWPASLGRYDGEASFTLSMTRAHTACPDDQAQERSKAFFLRRRLEGLRVGGTSDSEGRAIGGPACAVLHDGRLCVLLRLHGGAPQGEPRASRVRRARISRASSRRPSPSHR